MNCPRCSSVNPPVSHFCFACGQDLRGGDATRRDRFVLNPNEPVASLSLVSTIMPHGSGKVPQTYRNVLLLGLALPVISAALGLMPFAIVTAAFLIPVVYILYLYDVNLWEDHPIQVTVAAFGISAVLSIFFTILWRWAIFKGTFDVPLNLVEGKPGLVEILVVALFVPVVSEALKQLGPLFLASRPNFDDLMDGLTFGIISGVSFAAFETLIVHKDLIYATGGRTNAAAWVSIVINAAIIKPVVYGSATGIAVAEFSGLGAGYDGFTPRYYRGFLEAVLANVFFHLGLYLLGMVGGAAGAVLGMIWGAGIAAALILRVRTILQRALLEGGVEAAARGAIPKGAHLVHCVQCEMALLENAAFCIVCGSSARAAAMVAQRVGVPAQVAPPQGWAPEQPPPPPPTAPGTPPAAPTG